MGMNHKTPISTGSFLNANFIVFRAAKKPAIIAMIASLIFLYLSNYVSASSGGVMGGSDWGPPSDSSSSSDDSTSYNSYSSSYDCSSSCGPSSFPCSSCDYPGPNSERPESSVFGFMGFTFVAGIMMVVVVVININSRKTSVIKVQVGLFGNIRPLQSDLNQIARTINTSTRGGMRSVLTGTLKSLLAHHKSCTSTYSSSKILSSIDEGKKMFNQLSSYEQGKFDEETLINVNSVRRERTESTILAEASDMYLVVTILVAVQGRFEVSSINTCEELIEALQKPFSIPESKIMAVRVLWTPQQELDTLSSEQLLEDYPLLKPLRTI